MNLGMEGIGLYWCLIEKLYENGGYIELDQIEVIAYEFHINPSIISDLVNNYDLFKKTKKSFYSKSVLKRLKTIEEKSLKYKANAEKRWGQNNDPIGMQLHSDSIPMEQLEDMQSHDKTIKYKTKNSSYNTTKLYNYKDLLEYIKDKIKINPSEEDKRVLLLWLNVFSEKRIRNAIDITSSKLNEIKLKNKLDYTFGILKNWEKGKTPDKNTKIIEQKPDWQGKDIPEVPASKEEIKRLNQILGVNT